MKLTEEQAQKILWEDSEEFDTVEVGDFVADYKTENAEVIFKPKGTDDHYVLYVSREGSPFTDWHYGYHLDCQAVEQVEVTVKQWVAKTS